MRSKTKRKGALRSRRLYFPKVNTGDNRVCIDHKSPEYHYLVKVLRLEAGQPLQLFDGKGLAFESEILSLDKKNLVIEVQDQFESLKPALRTHLWLSVSKGERMDYALQKSTELGVSTITPVWSAHGEVSLKGDRLDKKMQHWSGVIASACEQCFQNYIPTLNAPIALESISNQNQELFFVCDAKGKSLHHYESAKPCEIHFLIGPEGGWAESELSLLEHKGISQISLGPRILRTETAPVVLLSLAQYLWGDFK